jgi:ATP-dependent Lhr-like helicase
MLWPALFQGEHVLLSAPTGSGKTLAALVPVYQHLLTDRTPTGVECLYVTPLRALCNDVRGRIEHHLKTLCTQAGGWFRLAPGVGVLTGDTPSRLRWKLRQFPPPVLVTTPESLALLLCHPAAERALRTVRWVVVDEVHALAPTKRGADLALSLERLAALADRDPQRIGLSATCAPLEELACWLGGTERAVKLAVVPDSRPWDPRIEYLGEADYNGSFIAALIERLAPHLESARTTLVFTNTRSLAERLTWSLRRRWPADPEAVAVHHGSLSREARSQVEHQLATGKVRVVMSTASLELGIDLGSVDQVVLVHPPGGVTRLLQRLGRSNHHPTGVRRGVIFTSSVNELQEAMVARSSGEITHLERAAIPLHPLDVLCQHLVGMSVQRPSAAADAWALTRRAYPYRNLTLSDFAACVEYLSGGRREELPPRLRLTDGRFRQADGRTAILYRRNVGTIVEERTVPVYGDDDHRFGALSASFADRLEGGDRFLLGGRALEVVSHHGVYLHAKEASGVPTFTHWEGTSWSLSQALAERHWSFRCRLKEAMLEGTGAAVKLLRQEYRLPANGIAALCAHFEEQEALSEIPATALIEVWPSGDGGLVCAFHLPLCTVAAEGVARVVARRMTNGQPCGVFPGLLGFALVVPTKIVPSAGDVHRLLAPEHFVADFDCAVADSPAVGRRFAEVATTALMLLRRPLGNPRKVGGPHWAGDKLFQWLRFTDPQSPLLRQALAEVRSEAEIPAALACLQRLATEPPRLRWLDRPSPFARAWIPGIDTGVAPPALLEDTLRQWHREERTRHGAGP